MLEFLEVLEAIRPAKRWFTITPSDTNSTPVFKALRFDNDGAITFDTQSETGKLRHVSAGEVWPVTNDAIVKIKATGTDGGLVIDAWG